MATGIATVPFALIRMTGESAPFANMTKRIDRVLSSDAAMKMIRKIISMQSKYLRACEASYLPDDLKERFRSLIEARTDMLR